MRVTVAGLEKIGLVSGKQDPTNNRIMNNGGQPPIIALL